MIQTSFINSTNILLALKHPKGLFIAAPSSETGYDKVWLRDNVYVALALERINIGEAVKLYQRIFDIFLKHEYKIDWAIGQKPDQAYKYIHARYNPESLEEFFEPWGNKQNDAIGAFLFNVGRLHKKGIAVIRDNNDIRILKKLIKYLQSIEYWHDKDSGMWEEKEEIHVSSVGACVAGLSAIKNIVDVPNGLIEKGKKALNKLLPRESETKDVDLALLSLIYPYNVIDDNKIKEKILKNVEEKLVRNRGVIRYIGDIYYNNGDGEAEWCFGFAWLAKIYKDLGNKYKYYFYIRKTIETMTDLGEIPELYYANTNEHNKNHPLAWAQSMYIIALGD